MKRFSAANSRLFMQIAVAASYSFGGYTKRWAAVTAEESTKRVVAYIEDQARHVERGARVIGSDAAVLDAIETGNEALVRANAVAMNLNLQFDVIMILDADGAVVAVTGAPDVRYGTRPFWGKKSWDSQRPRTLVTRLGSQLVLVAIRPLSAAPGGYSVAAATIIDEEFIDDAQIAAGDAFGFYDAQGKSAALGVGAAAAALPGAPMEPAMVNPDPGVAALIARARTRGSASGSDTYGSREYQLYARAPTDRWRPRCSPRGQRPRPIPQSAPARRVGTRANRTCRSRWRCPSYGHAR
jgi:hypothetical protein